MRMTLRALSALLSYPSSELQSHIGEVTTAIRKEGVLPREEIQRLEPLLRSVAERDLLDAQSDYSRAVRPVRSLSLHLFEHVHGDSRERGQAMIDLGRAICSERVFLDSSELPDFVPVFLEYASCLPPAEAIEVIGQPVHVFARWPNGSTRGTLPMQRSSTRWSRLPASGRTPPRWPSSQENEPVEDPSKIDEEWEEAPVSFTSGGAHEMGGPTGFVAKIRASNRPVNREAGR
jgi:nitrate reductase molybdenum cofactor assembly chaperone NarJ/NarW